MRKLIFFLIFLFSAGSGTLASAVLRKRLGNKLAELDSEETSEDISEEEHERES